METIGENYAIDVALLNIGGHFGMEPRMAAKAAQVMHARLAVPHPTGRRRLTVEWSPFDLLFRTSLLIRAVLNRHFRMMEARRGK
jgi:L-ascorbate metabolism protein UlaG (beta-lactamase superfamily)